MSNKALGNYFDKKAKQYTKKCKKTTYTETVTFTVVKTKKGWKIKNKSMAIVDIACGYMNEASLPIVNHHKALLIVGKTHNIPGRLPSKASFLYQKIA